MGWGMTHCDSRHDACFDEVKRKRRRTITADQQSQKVGDIVATKMG
jgi:hypothetical protein